MQRVWVRELAGWCGALAVALIAVAQVASSPRAELLFRDADSLVVALFSQSVASGEPLNWAMSSVLFVPESALFIVLAAVFPFEVNGLLALSAIVNLLMLYGAVRVAAGRQRTDMAPVAWSLIAVATFGVLAMTDVSESRDAFDLASLYLTTTYYSATVVATVLTVGIARRVIDRPAGGSALLVALGIMAIVSTLSNPLYAAWATAPLSIVLGVLIIGSRDRIRVAMLLMVLLAGTVFGLLARIPFQEWIANTGVGYAQPSQWMQSLEYYGGLVLARLSTPAGVVGGLLTLILLSFAILMAARTRDAGSRFIAQVAWIIPVLVMIGAIALGTHAARYLQPLLFAPMLALVAMPRAWPMSSRVRSTIVGGAAVLLTVLGGLSVPRLITAAESPDPDLACVTEWADASDRTGAGQFWSVRLPKLHSADAARLVQVDHELNGYAWLVNRHDFDVGEVSFLIEDAQTVPWSLPAPITPEEVVTCGRYRILDFGDASLPLGPARS